MMNTLQKWGGIAALVEGAIFLFGLALFFTVMAPAADPGSDASTTVAFLVEHQAVNYLWHMISYVGFGLVLVVLALALHERLRRGATGLMAVSTTYALIWAGLLTGSGMVAAIGMDIVAALYSQDIAQAITVWQAIDAVQRGIGGEIEIVGGLWVLLVSVAALRSGGLPRRLSYLGLLVGAAGIITVLPPLHDLGVLFGLGVIPWVIWLGVTMLRDSGVVPEPDGTALAIG